MGLKKTNKTHALAFELQLSAARATGEHDGPAVPAVGPVLPVCHMSPPAHLHSICYPTTPPCSLPLTRQTALLPRTHTTSAALHQPDVQTLQLTNQELVPVAFKMQTNRPKRYNVGPVQGILGPGETQNIEIHMKPLEVRAVWYGLSERRP